MARKLSRREFLRLSFIGLLGLLFSRQEGVYLRGSFRVDLDGSEKLDFDKLAWLADRFDRALDTLPGFNLEPNEENLALLSGELYTRYELEGFGRIRDLPEAVHFVQLDTSGKINGQLAESDCKTTVNINRRITNPLSPRYDDGWEWAAAHELAHLATGEDLCRSGDPAWRETSAQIGAVEVCAGLALEGSPYFFRLVVQEIRNMAMAGAYGIALVGGKLDRYEELRRLIWPGAAAEAAYQRQKRMMAENIPAELIWAYWVTPMEVIIQAVRRPDPFVDGLAFPPNSFTNLGGIFRVNPEPERRRLDDTKYLFENLEELANEAKK